MNALLVDVDWERAREEYRNASEAHAKAKNRFKRNGEKLEELLQAVLDAHRNEVLSDPDMLARLGKRLVRREELQSDVDQTKEAVKAATEFYGPALQDEEAD